MILSHRVFFRRYVVKKLTFLFALSIFLFVSCDAIIKSTVDAVTTAKTKYERTAKGIIIKEFENGFKAENVGFATPDGKKVESFSFNAPDRNNIMTCNEVPLDFFKIDEEPGKRSAGPNVYVGTWEAFIPLKVGFRRVLLDLKSDFTCSIFLEALPDENKDIKTRIATRLEGKVSNDTDRYKLLDEKGINFNGSGYASTFSHFALVLLKSKEKGKEYLTASFELNGGTFKAKLFEEKTENANKKVYVGTGVFSKENIGKEITFEVDAANNFSFVIPEGTKLPKVFNE